MKNFRNNHSIKITAMILFIAVMAPFAYGQGPKNTTGPVSKESILCIKFNDNLPVYARNGRLMDDGSGIVESLGLLQDAGFFEKMITCVSESRLDSMRAEAQAYWDEVERQNIGIEAGTLADMNNYIALKIKPGVDEKTLEAAFQSNPFVEYATILPESPAPPVPPNFVPQQNYLSTATGINAEQVYSVYNNHGAGVQVVDIEGAFNASHNDLPNIPLVLNVPMETTFGDNHGTSVLGQIVSKNNGWGTSGIAYDSPAKFAVRGQYWNNTIIAAANAIQPGDVILLELQLTNPAVGKYVPIEYKKVNYDAIKLVTGNKRVVVEAAGNGYQNLDLNINKKGDAGHYPFDNLHNSGAIIVGAGTNHPDSIPRSRRDFSNYGSRVNVQAFGENVVTTGGDITFVNGVQTSIPPVFYSAEGVNYYYTNAFGGTSSASPIVTGACLLIQSVLKNTNNTYLTSLQMQQLLMSTGKPQQGNTSENIGPMPDAYKAIQSLLNNSNCNAPAATQLGVTNVTSTSATLLCTAPGALSVRWAYRKVGVTSWTSLPETSAGSTLVTGLQQNRQYEFVVKIRCNSTNWSNWSSSVTFTTPVTSSCTSPSINQLSATSITNTSATLNCSLGGMISYDWNVRPVGTTTWNTLTETTSGIKNITGLQPGSNYEFRVRVKCNTTSWSNWSAEKTFTTNSTVTCNAPTLSQIWTSFITYTSATLNCSVPGSQGYDWRVRIPGGVWTDLDETSTGSYDLSNMNSGTTWEYAVRVKCSSTTWSDWSSNKIFSTLSCGTPSTSQLSASNITYNSATLNCSMTGVLYYDWAIRVYPGGSWENLDYTSTGLTNTFDLTAGTTYQYAVAVSCDGNNWSNWVYKTFTTPSCTAPSASEVWYSDLTDNSVNLHCSKPNVEMFVYAISVNNSGNWFYFETSYDEMTWNGLQPNTWYAYSVAASCDGTTWSNWSPIEYLLTYNFAGSETRDVQPQAAPTGMVSGKETSVIGKAYPNPSSDEVLIDLEQVATGLVEWKLTDQLGRVVLVREENMDAGTHQILIQTRHLATGIYSLNIRTQSLNSTQQLSVVH